MKTLKIEEIPEQGLQLDEALDVAFLSELLPENQDFAPKAEGHVKLHVQKQHGNVVLKGLARAEIRCACASCLKDVVLELKAKIDLVLFKSEPEKLAKDKDAEVVAFEDDDTPGEADGTGEYDGKVVDWGAQVREHLLLALPIAPRCREDCEGLCPVCGIDKNEARCNCVTKQSDPRWDKLKLLKLDGQ